MDHLTEGTNLNISIEVPLLQTPTYAPFYDDESFHEYSDRQGWMPIEFMDGDFTRLGTRSPDDAACFLQAWLFFGCLSEYLGDLFDYSDFIDVGVDGRALVTTKTLHRVLEKRRDIFLKEPRTFQTFLSRFQGQFGAYTTLGRYAVLFDPDFRFFPKCPVVPEVALSIIILGETLEYHVSTILEAIHLPSLQPEFHAPYKAEMPMSLLQKNGWCNGEILVSRRNYSASILTLMTGLGKRTIQRDHSRCNPTGRCRALDFNEATYETKHTRNGCECLHPSLQTDVLHDVILRNEIVVVNSTGKSPETWQYSTSQGEKFVAISHIWSDGLGNPTANSLPLCQLEIIKKRVDDLYGETTKNVPFWIDTLCVPVDSPLRKQAISQMKDVYKHAEKVLILDAEMLHINLSDVAIWENTECLLRLCSSNWWRRLWTLQEGVKAREIYFQFENRAISVRQIYDEIITRTVDSHIKKIHLRLAGDLWWSICWHAYRLLEEREPIRLLWNAVQFRLPSNKSDETICLGSLLDFSPQAMHKLLSIPKSEPKRRMQEFLLLQRYFPVDILFVPGNKFIEKPFHWAPTSFIFRSSSDDDIDVLATDLSSMGGPLCSADLRGMFMNLAGFRLAFDISKRICDVFWFRNGQGKWCQVYICNDFQNIHWGNLNMNRPRQPILLLREDEYEVSGTNCVLVDLEEEIDGVLYVTRPLKGFMGQLRLDWEDRPDRPKDRFGTFCKDHLRDLGNAIDFGDPQPTWGWIATSSKLEKRTWCVR